MRAYPISLVTGRDFTPIHLSCKNTNAFCVCPTQT
jgi:hypothetical protein